MFLQTFLLYLFVSLGLYILYRKFVLIKGSCRSKRKLHGMVAIVTGANTGIGKETAKDLAKRGARVILACRSVSRGESAKEEIVAETGVQNLTVMQLDLSSMASVTDFAKRFLQAEKRLDILVNNAGLGWVPRQVTKDGFEITLATNHLGHFLLTHLLLEILKSSAPSRVVNVSSIMYKFGKIDFDDIMMEKNYSQFNAYSRSKLSNILFTRELSRRLNGTGVTCSALHPGTVNTEFDRYMIFGRLPILKQMASLTLWLFSKTPHQGAQTTIYCTVAEELETISGRYYSECKEQSLSANATDDEAASKLWNISAKLVGVDPNIL